MHKAVKISRIIFIAATGAAIAMYAHHWNADAVTELVLTASVISALLGFGPPLVAYYVAGAQRAVVDHHADGLADLITTLHRQQGEHLAVELDAIRNELHRAINAARGEGRLDGALAERLGRASGDDTPAPRPRPGGRHHRPFNRLTDSGSHLTPVKD